MYVGQKVALRVMKLGDVHESGSLKVENSVIDVRICADTYVSKLQTLSHEKVQGAGEQNGDWTKNDPDTFVNTQKERFHGGFQVARGFCIAPPAWAPTGQ